jgi:hypothetical protein
MNNFETLMASANYANPNTGYPSMVDVASCVDVFIVNEMSKNVDGYRLSSYLYKKDVAEGGKLNMGPVWDYDLAWHNCNYAFTFDPTGWEYTTQDSIHPSPTWWTKFMQDTVFARLAACRWSSLRQNILSVNSINAYIDSVANVLNEPQKRNFVQWPILGTYIFPNPQSQTNATYYTEVLDLKTWVSNRFNWLDGAFQNYSCLTGVNAHEQLADQILVYPNPFENSACVKLNLLNNAFVSLSIKDTFGKTVLTSPGVYKPSGRSEIQFERTNLPAGVYLYQVAVNGIFHNGKLIIN